MIPRPRRRTFVALVSLFLLAAGLISYNRPDLLREGVQRTVRMLPDPLRNALVPKPDPLADRLAARGFSLGQPAYIRIFKQQAKLEVWLQSEGRYRLYDEYPICRFSGRLGPKLREGDRQAPEGFYAVSHKQLHPDSRHHRAFNLGFPNAYDQALGRTGSYLMVHGGCSSVGCYAMTDNGVDDIYRIVEAALDAGQPDVPVHVFPFQMTGKRLAAMAGERWIDFWRDLKTGYDLFEQTGEPPSAYLCGARYRFQSGGGCQPITGW